ncbi:MAG: ATP-dependent Clp protease ATP-binding subunit ClpB [Planctomycetota bacterium]
MRVLDSALIASARLADRHVTGRFMPDKAIDLMDEAAAQLRTAIDSMPPELDNLERRLRRLEIERSAITTEGSLGSATRVAEIESELAEISEEASALRARWSREKELITSIRAGKMLIESLRGDSEKKEREGDLEAVAAIRYGELPEAEEALAQRTAELENVQQNGALLPEAVDEEMIAQVVARWTGIPASKLLETEREKLLTMEDRIGERVIGQAHAIEAISEAVRRSRAGLQETTRPIGNFLLLGPTGVGKTEVARALAEFLFDDEKHMVRVDMSEYMEKHSVSRLIGAPPGYVGYDQGGSLTEAVRRTPHSVVLFDEVEKAHPDVFNVLLQLMDDGRMTDGQGRTVDFTQTLVLMTSNLRSENDLREHFRPEFLNRLDEVLTFDALEPDQIGAIAKVQLERVREHMAEQGIGLELTEAAMTQLAKDGFDPEYGARPLKRAIQRGVQNPIAKAILSARIARGEVAVVDCVEGLFIVSGRERVLEAQEV